MRVPRDAPALVEFAATVGQRDHRRELTRDYGRGTEVRYRRCFRRYQEWCQEVAGYRGHQAGADQITDVKLDEFVTWMTTERVPLYAPETVSLSIRALRWYAARHGVSLSGQGARGILDSYLVAIAKESDDEEPPKLSRRASA